jgi:DNA-binding NarL/FixJ family response regulator/signal transduction histidine kinase
LQIVIDDVIANGRRLPVSNKIVLSPEETRLEISYLAIRMRSQEGLRYRYRMEGLEPWIDASGRRTVNYTQLPAGRYLFRVQGFAVDNPESVSETSIVIVKEPHFYTTLWFLSCCVLGALGLVILMYRLKLRQMKIRFHAVSEERARLAREMHDTVIQGCVGVSTLLEAALEVEASEDLLRHQLLSYANEQVRTTIEEAREAVWDLRNHAELKTDAGSLCEELAREFQSDYEIPIQCHISGMRFELGESATHELMMMLREVLSNAHAHGNPREINLYVRFLEDHLKIEVRDNGSGFDPQEAMSIKKHYGLVGLQERAKLLGGKVSVVTEPVNPEKIKVLVVDDHPVVRVGISTIIDTQQDMTVVAETGSGEEAVTLFQEHLPDLTVMDLRLKKMNGAASIRKIREEFPDAKIVVLTTYRGDEDIHQALAAGASGYLIKGMPRQVLLDALRRVHQGERFLPPPVTKILAARKPASELSARERQVLSLLAAGKCNKEISADLGIAEITVKCHLSLIFLRLNVTDRTQAVIAAVQRGLVHL